MIALLPLLAALTTADATPIGTEKTFGLGLTVGVPSAVTGKYWLDPKSGITFYAGTNFGASITARGQYDREILEIFNLDWARMPLYWYAGGNATLFAGGGVGVGAIGGVGAALQFHKVPAEVFVEPGIGVGWWNASVGNPLWPSWTFVSGGRWYF